MSSVERGLVSFDNVEDWSQTKIVTSLDNMITNVNNMIKRNGPVYSTWIYFQLGKSAPLTFNTSTTDPDRNIIASLEIEKGNSGCANTFTLTVNFDPFNFGQETKSKVELLDEYVAEAMYVDWNSNDEDSKLRGVLQYGYNPTGNDDDKLVTPQYEFILTSAKSSVQYSTGTGTYTFEGTSTLGASCDTTQNFPEVTGKPLSIVVETLYTNFGDSEHIPNGVDSSTTLSSTASKYKYRIEVSQDLIDGQQQEEITWQKQDGISVWQYCTQILEKYCRTQANIDSGLYDDLDNMNEDEKPRYIMYITDTNDAPTIHITHITPKESSQNDALSYEFSWSNKDNNLIVSWNPEADLYLYLITKFKYLTLSAGVDKSKIEEQSEENNGVTETWEDKVSRAAHESLLELYNSTMVTVGIPADVPIAAEVRIIPTVLESVSRTAGVYIFTGASDSISTNGVYTTTFKLFRIRGLNDADYEAVESTENTTGLTVTSVTQISGGDTLLPDGVALG